MNRERIWTPEMREKVARAKRGVPVKSHVAEANRSRRWDEAAKERQSIVLSKVPHTIEWNRKIAAKLAGRRKPRTPEWQEKIRLANLGRVYGAEVRSKWSEAAKRRWRERPEYREKILAHLSRVQKPTSIENILYSYLLGSFDAGEISKEYRIGKFRVDFAVPSRMLVFEADGEYWHKDKEADRLRDSELTAQGWRVLRFDEQWLKALITLA